MVAEFVGRARLSAVGIAGGSYRYLGGRHGVRVEGYEKTGTALDYPVGGMGSITVDALDYPVGGMSSIIVDALVDGVIQGAAAPDSGVDC